MNLYKNKTFVSANDYWQFDLIMFETSSGTFNIYCTKTSINNTYCGESVIRTGIKNKVAANQLFELINYSDINNLKYEIY